MHALHSLRLVFFLTIFLLPSLCFSAPKKIGVVGAFTGPVAEAGKPFQQAIQMAAEEAGDDITFLYADDAYQPKNTVSAVRKFISQNHIDGLIVFGSGPAMAIAKTAESNKIPTLVLSSLDTVTNGKRYVMRHYLSTTSETGAILKEIESRNYKRIAILSTTNEATIPMVQKVKEVLGSKIVFVQDYAASENDFRADSAKILALQADAVFLAAMPPHNGLMAKQLRTLNFQGDLFSGHMVEIDAELKDPKGALAGSWYVGLDDRNAGAFKEAFQKKFGNPPTSTALVGYDIAKLMIKAFQSPNPNVTLHSIKKFSGALGEYAPNGNAFEPGAIVKIVR